MHHPRIPVIQTYINLITIEMSGHKGCGKAFDCEVEFTMTRIYPQTYDEPAVGGEVEIIAVRPYEYRIVEATGRLGTIRHMIDCPKWLSELLLECVDADALSAED